MSNYGFDEHDANSAVTRETMHQQPQQPYPPQPMQYGYPQQPPAWGRRSPYGLGRGPGLLGYGGTTETKPFFLTSEFVVSLFASVAIAISAATMHAFGGWRAWILIAAIVCSYNLSRGIAKAGTRSHAHDPREDVRLGESRDRELAHDGR
jgi:hypothetical protein